MSGRSSPGAVAFAGYSTDKTPATDSPSIMGTSKPCVPATKNGWYESIATTRLASPLSRTPWRRIASCVSSMRSRRSERSLPVA
jgi:hypothetical protein